MQKKSGALALGLMSGTSADGISIALVKIIGKKLNVLSQRTYPYSRFMQDRIIRARLLSVRELSRLNFELGRIFSGLVVRFCREEKVSFRRLAVIGSHGQTVCHHPSDNPAHTLQIGEPSFIAEATGVPVVADFRPADVAAGGEGAPLVPFMDEYLFGNGPARILQNIGGIGNLAAIGKGVKTKGFDTGPGNCLMDAAVRQATKGRMTFDRDGELAASGRINFAKVEKFLKMPFFSKRPPKSLDREHFGLKFLFENWRAVGRNNLKDMVATLNWFTARSIETAVKKFAGAGFSEMTVSGGGALNPVLMRNLGRLLAPIKVTNIADCGINPLAKEPACFALLAHLALEGIINHCPSATGARGRRILGKIIRVRR
ncbi:MAG: anhydro-N-acetylmuramic acid kinase [bacterium]